MRIPATVHSIGELPKPNAKQDTVPLEHHEAMIAALKAHIAHLQANIAAANKQTDQWREIVDHYWRALIAEREARQFIVDETARAQARAELRK